jgi:1-acyl-sn-glycerol-3-phosphate acyltransferase
VAALMSGAPDLLIVPTVIDGSWRVFANNMFPIPYGTRVRVRFGNPIERTPDEDPAEITQRCATWARDVLRDWDRES